jgi:hypothetical protein
MTSRWNIGNMAVIGGLTAVVMLLTGIPAAKADELADLHAHQLLVQQRIGQLSQPQAPLETPDAIGSNVNGAAAAPSPLLDGGSFPRSFVIPGTDTSIRVGGSIDETLDSRAPR